MGIGAHKMRNVKVIIRLNLLLSLLSRGGCWLICKGPMVSQICCTEAVQ